MHSTPAVSLDCRDITAISQRFEKRFALIANTMFRLPPARVDRGDRGNMNQENLHCPQTFPNQCKALKISGYIVTNISLNMSQMELLNFSIHLFTAFFS